MSLHRPFLLHTQAELHTHLLLQTKFQDQHDCLLPPHPPVSSRTVVLPNVSVWLAELRFRLVHGCDGASIGYPPSCVHGAAAAATVGILPVFWEIYWQPQYGHENPGSEAPGRIQMCCLICSFEHGLKAEEKGLQCLSLSWFETQEFQASLHHLYFGILKEFSLQGRYEALCVPVRPVWTCKSARLPFFSSAIVNWSATVFSPPPTAKDNRGPCLSTARRRVPQSVGT